MTTGLSNPEKAMLLALRAQPDSDLGLADVLEACGWSDQAIVAGAGMGLCDSGMAESTEERIVTWKLGAEGERAHGDGLLERRVWDWISKTEETSMDALSTADVVAQHEVGIVVGLLKNLGVSLAAGSLCLPKDTEAALQNLSARTEFLASLDAAAAGISQSELDDDLLAHFRGRKGLLESTERTTRAWRVTSAGLATDKAVLAPSAMIGEISAELLQGDEWKNAQFKPYDVTLPAATPLSGKPHPMQSLIERIRSIFLEMGFTEIEGDYVQSAGWNMDALFIPQDHPAREVQDTFYLSQPEQIEVDEDRIAQWAAIHEHGGETGSRGWGGEFSTDIAQRGLLRTHTTVNTIRYLAEHPTEPCRVFGIGRVFRNESIDRTHLPEFHQIEGIIMEPDANLPMLVTTLKTFYAKMGYPEVRVRPAYFPYTEPSLEVEIKWRGKWLELGGAGIFRPEVTEPLSCMGQVCAWGMGLERLAMLVLGLDDIRQLYISDLEWLRSQPVL